MSEARVTELRAELFGLAQKRAAAIQEINARFDQRAVELNRQIEAIEPPFHCVICGGTYQHRENCSTQRAPIKLTRKRATRRPRQVNMAGMSDWSEADIAHYKQLQEKKRA